MKNPVVELFADQSLSCGEGPVWDANEQCLFWTDSGGSQIFKSHAAGGGFSEYTHGIHAASLILHENGGLVICGKKGFYHIVRNEPPRLISGNCGDIPIDNINDIIADPHGRIFGGQESFCEYAPYTPGYLFRLGAGGEAKIMDEGLHLSNGMGFSPGLDRFYLVDTIPGNVYVYDYHLESGNISNRQVLVHLEREEGLPDGMTVDAEGFIWVARWFGNGLSRFDPDGKLERKLTVPAAQTSSLTFGGACFNEIFITSAAVHWETALAPRRHFFSSHRGGGLYRVVQDILGKQEYKTNL